MHTPSAQLRHTSSSGRSRSTLLSQAQPTVISGPQADEVVAYLLLISKVWRPVLAGILTPVHDSESSYLEISRATMSNTTHSSETTIAVDGVLRPLDVRPGQTIRIDNFTFVVSSKESYPILQFRLRQRLSTMVPSRPQACRHHAPRRTRPHSLAASSKCHGILS